MPRIDAVVQCPVHNSFRVQQVAGMFDVPVEEKCCNRFQADIPDDEQPWQIGAIVGPSGSGKSTIARQAFGKFLYQNPAWPDDRALVDCLGDADMRQITHTLTAVGLSSPPAWIRPYRVLSGGEQFRADLARALLSEQKLVVFDEFTSVVDRTVAKFGSAAVSKALRRGQIQKRFVAVTCHYDIVDWLQPDWVVDMRTASVHWGNLRRPTIELNVVRCQYRAWRLFSRHHYLSRSVNKAARCYLALWQEDPVAFCALLALPGRRNHWRVSRIVVLPDYQGVGIGTRVVQCIAALYARDGQAMSITTSHPAMIAALRRSPRWRVSSVNKLGHKAQAGARTGVLTGYIKSVSRGRAVVSFKYVGGDELANGRWVTFEL